MKFASHRRPGADINLTPLIDILFIVLLFLVLTATFSERSVLQIALPKTTTGEVPAGTPGRLRIEVDADDALYVDGELRTLDDVGLRLRAIPDKDGAVVTVAADERARHGRVIAVIDAVRQAGLVRLDIETFVKAPTSEPR